MEVCQVLLESGYTNYKVTVIDNQFFPERVSWLTRNGFHFYQKEIFDCKELLEQSDIVIHTAGETMVPTVASQATPEIDSKITRVGTEGTRFVIKHTPKYSDIIFLSTHVVFEGIQPTTLYIDERFKPCPVLAYSKSKAQSEIDLFDAEKNFVVLRLASIYGYNPSIRWRILPNLFSKMAAQGQDLKVFGDGSNIKPIVGIRDVANIIVSFCKSRTNWGVYHVVNENKTVLDLAKICQSYNPTIKIIHTNDEIPNAGYKVSGELLRNKLKYKFTQNIEEEVGKMIYNWKNK